MIAAHRRDAVAAAAERGDDPRLPDGRETVAARPQRRDALGRDEPLLLPEAQRRGAHAEGGGELGDRHRVIRSLAFVGRPPRPGSHAAPPGRAAPRRVRARAGRGRRMIAAAASAIGLPAQLGEQPPRGHRPDRTRESSIGAEGVHVDGGVGAVPVRRSGGRRDDAQPLQVADLLHRVARRAGDVDRSERCPWRPLGVFVDHPTPQKHLKVMLEL